MGNLHTKVKSTFWADDAVGDLDPQAKLAVIWLMTNADCSPAGITHLQDRKFKFDTGLPDTEPLVRACEALGKGIVRAGQTFWMRHYIHHQWGRTAALKNNNMAKSIVRSLKQERLSDLVEQVLGEYEELRPLYGSEPEKAKPLPSSYQGQERKGEDGNGLDFPPSVEKVHGFAASWAGDNSGAPNPIPPEFVDDWLSYWCGREDFPVKWQAALPLRWRSRWRKWQEFHGRTGAPSGRQPDDVAEWWTDRVEQLAGSAVAARMLGETETAKRIDAIAEQRKGKR